MGAEHLFLLCSYVVRMSGAILLIEVLRVGSLTTISLQSGEQATI